MKVDMSHVLVTYCNYRLVSSDTQAFVSKQTFVCTLLYNACMTCPTTSLFTP